MVNSQIPIGRKFDEMLRCHELFQDQFTYRKIEHGQVTSMARLDRIYINLVPIDAMDAHPLVAIFGKVGAWFNGADHSPVVASISMRGPPVAKLGIQTWVTGRSEFAPTFSMLSRQVEWPIEATAKLEVLKSLLHDSRER